MIITKEIHYNDGNVICQGFLAYPNNVQSMPAVMIAHDWRGRSQDACNKAIELAKSGYLGFAIDLYGAAKLGHDKEQCRALMSPLIENRQKLLARIRAAFTTLTHLPQVDKTKIAAIGYCFGGLCVLDLARSGCEINGVVSFHGLLSAPPGSDFISLTTKILILHGEDDKLVPPEQIEQFAEEMTKRNADWQIHRYGLTAHSFTNPHANDPEMGLHYNKKADQRSWQSTLLFLNDLLETHSTQGIRI
jgi:dienelactone hydrolase